MANWTSQNNATDRQLLADGKIALAFALQDIPFDLTNAAQRTTFLDLYITPWLNEMGYTAVPNRATLRSLLGV